MHVNSYFIETLVLCFSCCNDPNNIHSDANWSNSDRRHKTPSPDNLKLSNTSCSMNAGNMVIGKQIQWTDKVGTECTGNGPIEHNLESIKDIIRLQFVTPPPSCNKESPVTPPITDAAPIVPLVTESSVTPPITDAEPIVPSARIDAEPIVPSAKAESPVRPPITDAAPIVPSVPDGVRETKVGDVVITVPQENASVKVLLKEEQTYADDVITWTQEHPNGQIIIIIFALESSDITWPLIVSRLINNSTNTSTPAFVILVDWSKYSFGDYVRTVEFANVVAKDLTTLIHDLQLPVNRLTLIGLGTSAHVAGHIGYLIQTLYNETLYRIIAFNPIALIYDKSVPAEHPLTQHDAAMVMVIHTETSEIGYCCNLGSIDVYVNHPVLGQPFCPEGDRNCAHESAVDIFIVSYIYRPVVVQKVVTNELLVGFPLDIPINTTGVYQLITEKDGVPKRYVPEIIQPKDAVKTTFVVPIRETQITEMTDWMTAHPHGQVIMILATGRISGHNWTQNLTQIIKDAGFFASRYILVVEWSETEPDFVTSLEHFKQVADGLTTMLYNAHVTADRLTIIAFGVSAHVAGLIGKLFQTNHEQKLQKIIALDPLNVALSDVVLVEDRLNKDDASSVMVIHTESDQIGYCCPIGTIDVFVNDPYKGQPGCDSADRQCSHDFSIQAFITATMVQPVILRKNITDEALPWYPLDTKNPATGVYFLKTTDTECDSARCRPEVIGGNIILVHENSSTTLPLQNQSRVDEITQWVEKHPGGDVFIIITAGETVERNWELKLSQLILNMEDSVPKYVVVVDWSKNYSPDDKTNFIFSKWIANDIATLILNSRIPVHKITMLGFGINAYLAGIVAKLLREKTNFVPHQIIALDPLGTAFTVNVPKANQLNGLDAKVVLVIHTETSQIGHCCNEGTIDVLVNDPMKGQPWCDENDRVCSHEAAINILISSYELHSVLVTNIATDEQLVGFPLNVPEEIKGVYYMDTGNNGDPIPVAKANRMETYDRDSWPVLNFTQNPNDLPTKLQMLGFGPHLPELVHILPEQPSEHVTNYLIENPLAEVFVIVTEQPYDDWALQLCEAVLNRTGPKFMIIADWSKCVSPSYIDTSSYALAVAQAVSKVIQMNNIPHELIEIIGFSTSAHIAGLIGALLQTEGGKISRVTALDPEHRMWVASKHRLSSSAANTVEVVHTNTKEWGILDQLGTHDFYVNGGERQPACSKKDIDVDACSHRLVIDLYIESATRHHIAHQARMEGSTAVVSHTAGDETAVFGYDLAPQANTQGMMFVLDTNIEKPYLEDAELNIQVQKIEGAHIENPDWPPIEFVSVGIYKLVLNFIYRHDSGIKKISIGYSGRNPTLLSAIRKAVPIDEKTSIFIVLDGEYILEESWADVMADRILEGLDSGSVIIHVDWGAYIDRTYYSLTACYAKAIGETVATALSAMDLQFPNIHIIGFSIGAHIAGFIGKEVQAKRSAMIGQITGLDPARPMFDHTTLSDASRLSIKDASLVDVYHTNAGVYGYRLPMGTIDFYINGGVKQPGCSDNYVDFCHHIRSVLLYIESVDIRAKALEVSYEDSGSLAYISNANLTDFGIHCKLGSQPGVYHIITASKPNYLKPFSLNISNTNLPANNYYENQDSSATEDIFNIH